MEHVVFSTALGRMAVAWNEIGLCEVLLPGEKRAPAGRPGRPSATVRRAVRLIQSWARGRRVDLGRLPLDVGGSPFARRLYAEARRIPQGRTVTYGDLARRLGRPGAARAVGTVLGRNPVPLIVPCHRVVSVSGKLGGFSAAGGVRLKEAMLRLEGASPGPLRNGRARRAPAPRAGRAR